MKCLARALIERQKLNCDVKCNVNENVSMCLWNSVNFFQCLSFSELIVSIGFNLCLLSHQALKHFFKPFPVHPIPSGSIHLKNWIFFRQLRNWIPLDTINISLQFYFIIILSAHLSLNGVFLHCSSYKAGVEAVSELYKRSPFVYVCTEDGVVNGTNCFLRVKESTETRT